MILSRADVLTLLEATIVSVLKDTNHRRSGVVIMSVQVSLLLDFSLTVKAGPHECVTRTGQP